MDSRFTNEMAAVTERGWLSFNGKRALAIATITCCIIFAFESAKMALSPKISLWASHAITALFVTVVRAIVSFVVLRRVEWLRLEMASTEARYKCYLKEASPEHTEQRLMVACLTSMFCRMFGYASRAFGRHRISQSRRQDSIYRKASTQRRVSSTSNSASER